VYSLYSLLFFLALLVSTPWWLLQMWRHGKYRTGWSERLGSVPDRLLRHQGKEPILSPKAGEKDGAPDTTEDTIWVHAVSVGEVLAMTHVIELLQARLPDWRIVVSTTTDTGQELARQRFGEANVFYLPLDLPFAVRPYLQALRPKLLVLAESEFWPNLLRWARLSGVAVAVVNARVSDRSLPGYLRFRALLARMLGNVDLFLAQSEEDARRLVRIGAPAERVQVSGNLKFEMKPPAKSHIVGAIQAAVQKKEVGPVIVVGSTLDPEEGVLIFHVFRQVQERYGLALLVLAPRHPERFDKVAELIESTDFPCQRRSRWDETIPVRPGIFLLDSIGELAAMYEVADIAFVGGSLVPRGGHNIVEAAQFGKATLVGPHTDNFRDIMDIFKRADAVRVLTTTPLAQTFLELLGDREAREGLGRRALEVMRSQQGATERTVAELLRVLRLEVPAVEVHSEGRA
jgi:3-deoxy-D-manno-octulosonic-acid transferase